MRRPIRYRPWLMTVLLDFDDVLPCPHCSGVLMGRWVDHHEWCPAATEDHSCGVCDVATDLFAKRRL